MLLIKWRPQGDSLRFTQDKFTSLLPPLRGVPKKFQSVGRKQKEEGQLKLQLTLFFYMASPRGSVF